MGLVTVPFSVWLKVRVEFSTFTPMMFCRHISVLDIMGCFFMVLNFQQYKSKKHEASRKTSKNKIISYKHLKNPLKT